MKLICDFLFIRWLLLIPFLSCFALVQAQVPGAPTSLVVTPIDNGGMIQFTAPSNDGGSSITNYEYSVDNGVSWVTPSPAITASPLIITSGLTNCTSYQVMLRAVNISGSGASSSVEQFVPGQSMGIGINWIACTQATDNYWRSVTYGNGLFVAVSTDGPGNQVMTSPDGINWTARASAVNNIWISVTYGNGLFVAVSADGTGNRVMTSPDGINWTSRASAVDNSWISITYGNGLFVAVSIDGTGNQVMTSPDGISWTSRASAVDNYWRSITYGNGLFVALAGLFSTGNRVMTSPDGITWTARSLEAVNDLGGRVDNYPTSVTYGNGLFVALSESYGMNEDSSGWVASRVMVSSDGVNWMATALEVDNTWKSVTYGNGLFVAVSADGSGNQVMTSPDGINWTSRASAVDNSWQSVTYGNGIFVAVGLGEGGNLVMTSSYSVVVDAPVIGSIDARNEGTKVTFSNTASAFAPQIINYEYSIDRGSNWITLSSGANVSPMVIYDLPKGKSTIMLRGVNSIGNSCPSNIFSLVPGINILAYPNPTRGDVGLELNGFDVGEAEIRLLDLSGKLLLTQKVALKTGLHLVSLQLKNLIIGNYIVQVVQHGKYYSTRFTKM
jgi:hypothetical protein